MPLQQSLQKVTKLKYNGGYYGTSIRYSASITRHSHFYYRNSWRNGGATSMNYLTDLFTKANPHYLYSTSEIIIAAGQIACLTITIVLSILIVKDVP